MRFVAALLAAAIAVTVTTGGDTEVWVLPDDPNLNWVQTTTTVEPVVLPADPLKVYMAAVTTTTVAPTTAVHVHTADRACVTIPIHVEDDGDLFLGPESERTHTGGLAVGGIRASMVGHYLNIAFGYSANTDSRDMELSSIDITGLTEVTICE